MIHSTRTSSEKNRANNSPGLPYKTFSDQTHSNAAVIVLAPPTPWLFLSYTVQLAILGEELFPPIAPHPPPTMATRDSASYLLLSASGAFAPWHGGACVVMLDLGNYVLTDTIGCSCWYELVRVKDMLDHNITIIE